MSPPTIYDVAKKAGVGIGTVSRVLNENGKVAEATRQRVLRAIEELQFKPNYAARKLPRKSHQRKIGVLTQPFLSHPSFVERLRGVQTVLFEQADAYELILYSVMSVEQFDEQIKNISQHGVIDALLIIDFHTTLEQRQRLDTVGIPYVEINHNINATWPTIVTDNRIGGAVAARYLYELGHRQIAYIGDVFENPYGFTTSEERLTSFKDTLADYGLSLPDEYIHLGPHGFDVAKLLTRELLDQVAALPTAIFAMSDMQALGCIAALEDAGLQVPSDVSVLGYDNLLISRHSGLSTIDQHLELSGQRAIEYLIAIQQDRAVQPPALPDPLVVPRRTTRAI